MTDDDTYPNAGRESGYVDAEGKPVGENLVNRITELMSTLQTKQLLDRQEVANLAIEVRAANQRADTIYGWLEREFKTNAKWRSTYTEDLNAVLAAVRDGAARLGKIEAEQERQAAIIASRPEQRQAEHQAIIEEIAAPIQVVMERLDQKRRELDEIHAWRAAIDKRLEKLERGDAG